MTDPYVYTPPRVEYRNSPYLAPFLNQQYSPFIPHMSLSGSPFVPNVALPPDSPSFNPEALPWSPFIPNDSPFPDDEDYIEPVNPWSTRRRLSWNGGAISPAVQNPANGWLQPRRPRRQRTRSDSGYFDQPQVVNINNGYWMSPGGSPHGGFAQLPPVTPQLALHPYLDAQLGRGDIVFDLSLPQFCPMRIGHHGQTTVLSGEELAQVATHPPIFTIKIISDLIPTWPVDIAWNSTTSSYSPVPVPIKVGDVLNAIWHAMQARISQSLWASLNPQQTNAVSRTFTARCKAARGYEMAIVNDGVKRIDFLAGKRWFRGLVRTGDRDVFKMHVV